MPNTEEKKEITKNGMSNGKMCPCGCENCGCGGGYGFHGFHHGFRAFRILLGVIILMVVFWFGFALGRFHGGYRGFGPGGYRMMYPGGMMYGYGTGGGIPPTPTNGATTAPATSSAQ